MTQSSKNHGNSTIPSYKNFKTVLVLLLLLTGAFFIGRFAARTMPTSLGNLNITGKISESEGNWGLSFPEEGKAPVANATIDQLKNYDAYYAEDTEEKVLYLTFDCGYENGYTPAILDALKKHNAPATFFVVGNYISTSADLIKRMTDEGHIVANHTNHHPDMSSIGKEDFARELQELEELYRQTTGKEMLKFYRPPQGKYSESNLKLAKELGYKTFFWSLAYVDWNVDSQPSHEEAFDKLLSRVHPGAIVLLHNTSRTNGEILDELLTKWEEMGYTFRSLEELPGVKDTNEKKHSMETKQNNNEI